MAVPQFRYPLDKTGENPNNFVGNERHSLNPQPNLTNVRVLAPYYGPFFSNSIRIVDMANGRQLIKDTDYKITDLLQDAALSFGAPIGQFVVIINGLVSNEVAVSYQVLGGNYQNDATAIQHVYETFLNDTRPVDWSNISGKPLEYPPSLHIHLLEDVIGFGPVIVALEQVKEAILLGNTPVIQALIDWVKERKVSWNSLVDIPPNLSGNFVPLDRTISTSPESGLVGGGNLTTDRSLSLQRLFTEAKTYGSAKESLSITVDVFGRVSGVIAHPIVLNWSSIEGKPTTAGGYGITDVVKLSGNQTVAGTKTFSSPITGNLTGNAGTADTLKTPRTIGLSGAATGTPTSFNGGANISIPVTALNADSLTSGTVPKSRLEGLYDNVSIKFNGYNTLFRDMSPGSTNTAARVVFGLAAYRGSSSTTTGAIVFTAPTSAFSIMHEMEVLLMTYSPARTAKLLVNGYRSTTAAFSNCSCVQLGSLKVDVRWGINPEGKTCLILGDVNTVWSYPAASITQAILSHSSVTDAYCTNWATSLVTDLTGYTALTAAGDTPMVGNISGNAATATSVPFTGVTGKPSTLGGYGITDAVTISTAQTVTGKKTFDDLVAKLGSLAANIHDAGFSKIVSEDFLTKFFNDKFSSSSVGGVTVIELGGLVIQYGVAGNLTWTNYRGTRSVRVRSLRVPYRYMVGMTSVPPYTNNIVAQGKEGSFTPTVQGCTHNQDPALDSEKGALFIPSQGSIMIEHICLSEYNWRYMGDGSEAEYGGLYPYIEAGNIRDFWLTIGVPW